QAQGRPPVTELDKYSTIRVLLHESVNEAVPGLPRLNRICFSEWLQHTTELKTTDASKQTQERGSVASRKYQDSKCLYSVLKAHFACGDERVRRS
ncbi:hypothetical protein BaRGS_00025645, partial [Batillaria attramentaria]